MNIEMNGHMQLSKECQDVVKALEDLIREARKGAITSFVMTAIDNKGQTGIVMSASNMHAHYVGCDILKEELMKFIKGIHPSQQNQSRIVRAPPGMRL